MCSEYSAERKVIMRKCGASLALINLIHQNKINQKENQNKHDAEMYKPLNTKL